MDKKTVSIPIIISVILLLVLTFGCAAPPPVNPFDSLDTSKVAFTFEDTDPDKNEIGGTVKLDLGIFKQGLAGGTFVVYWGSTSGNSGKGAKLDEVASDFPGVDLLKIPANTSIDDPGRTYLLLYARTKDIPEEYLSLSIRIEDFVVEEPEEMVAEEPVAAVVEEPVETVVEEPVETVVEEPVEMVVEEPVKAMVEEPAKAMVEEPVVTMEPETVPPPQPDDSTMMSTKQVEPVVPVAVVIEIDNVLFDFDKSKLRAEYKDMLDQLFWGQEDKDQLKVVIAGHADERGSNEYNLALGERRAYAVKQYLVSLGLMDQNIRIISYGEEMPIDPRHTEEAWRKNRRAETTIE